MRIMIGSGAVLALAVAAGLGSPGVMTKSGSGLGQLMSATIAPGELGGGTSGLGMANIAWQAPGAQAPEASIALSEQDWLKLSGDVAPVSYLDPQAPAPAPAEDQQPL